MRRAHSHVVSDAAKLPPSVRRNVARPEPAAISRPSRSDSRICSTGMKNSATPMPMISCTPATCAKSTCRLKPERRKLVKDRNTNAKEAIQRMSKRDAYLPTNGDMITGRMPIGAVARPAQIAV
ncbi:hypothetical protein D9M71_736890 [compost metagenome]